MRYKAWCLILTFLFSLAAVSASDAKPFYEGKTIKLIVCTKPGGGFDYYGRLAAKYMNKYLPGSNIIVKNVPGGGHIIGVNTIYQSKPDGLTFGIFDRSMPLPQIAGLKGVKYDMARMSWLGSCATDPRVLVTAKNRPYTTIQEAVKSKVRFATNAVGAMDYFDALLFQKILGADKWEVITGYMGGEGELALMRGEADGMFGSWSSFKPFVENGEGRALLFSSDEPVKGYENVPLLSRLAGQEYSAMVDLMLFFVKFNRPFAGPPGIASDRLGMLRDAFNKAFHDPELLDTAKKMKRPINYIGYQQAEKMIKGVLKQSTESVKLIKATYGIK